MIYQKPSVFVIDKDLVEALLPVYEVACHCTSGGARVCHGASSLDSSTVPFQVLRSMQLRE